MYGANRYTSHVCVVRGLTMSYPAGFEEAKTRFTTLRGGFIGLWTGDVQDFLYKS